MPSPVPVASRLIEQLCSPERGTDSRVLGAVVTLAIAIAREGREGRKIGTLFSVGHAQQVLARSRCLILDPLAGHPDAAKHIEDPDLRETVKELAQLDGGFVVSDEGIVVSATRYFESSAQGIEVPLGMGTRHIAAASISRQTGAVAVVVSERAIVRLFDRGELVAEILPELWTGHPSGLHLEGDGTERETEGELTVLRRRRDMSPPRGFTS